MRLYHSITIQVGIEKWPANHLFVMNTRLLVLDWNAEGDHRGLAGHRPRGVPSLEMNEEDVEQEVGVKREEKQKKQEEERSQ